MFKINDIVKLQLISGTTFEGIVCSILDNWMKLKVNNSIVNINTDNIEFFSTEEVIIEKPNDRDLIKPIDFNSENVKEIDVELRAMKLVDLKKVQIEQEKSNIKDYMSENKIKNNNTYYQFPSFKKKL